MKKPVMNLKIPRSVFAKVKAWLPENVRESIDEEYRTNTYIVDSTHFTVEQLRQMAADAKEKEPKFANTVEHLVQILTDPNKVTVRSLEMLAPALHRYFEDNKIDGWIYSKGPGGEPLPFLLTERRSRRPGHTSRAWQRPRHKKEEYICCEVLTGLRHSSTMQVWTTPQGAAK